jgi:hypothetical protein
LAGRPPQPARKIREGIGRFEFGGILDAWMGVGRSFCASGICRPRTFGVDDFASHVEFPEPALVVFGAIAKEGSGTVGTFVAWLHECEGSKGSTAAY